MNQIMRIGIDTSKHIFQLYGVNTVEQPVLRKRLRRQDMVAFVSDDEPVPAGPCLADRQLDCPPSCS